MDIGEVYFERYKILDILGKGGTSNVYLAENIKIGSKWTIKKVLKEGQPCNLLAEPNILKDLDHIAIPRIIDIEEDDHAIYIIREYVNGICLKDFKREEPQLQSEQIVNWALQLCDVLKYLHERKPYPIIYRDMKPENIMLMPEGKIKLIDFGIAREFKEDSLNDTVPIGTKGYAAPEQYGIGQSDERTDIFSLGVTLYYLLTNKNLMHPPYQIQRNEQLNSESERQLLEIILKCCELLPDRRYQTVDALLEDLLKIHAPKENTAEEKKWKPEPLTERKKSWSFKKKEKKIEVKKTMVLGFIGVSRGVGVTHTSILLAHYLAKKFRVAILELNPSMHFKEICKLVESDEHVHKKCFSYHKVHYQWDMDFGQFISRQRESFDFILLDLGCFHDFVNMEEFIRADLRFVIGQGMDWKIKEIQSFYKDTRGLDPNNHWVYLMPFMDKRAIKKLNIEMEEEIYCLPYNMDPFAPGLEMRKVFERLLMK